MGALKYKGRLRQIIGAGERRNNGPQTTNKRQSYSIRWTTQPHDWTTRTLINVYSKVVQSISIKNIIHKFMIFILIFFFIYFFYCKKKFWNIPLQCKFVTYVVLHIIRINNLTTHYHNRKVVCLNSTLSTTLNCIENCNDDDSVRLIWTWHAIQCHHNHHQHHHNHPFARPFTSFFLRIASLWAAITAYDDQQIISAGPI